jgi:hypothetical protein
MDKSALVSFDIANGEEIINALDHAGKNPNVALWAKFREYEDWRLVIASDRINQTSALAGYDEIYAAMDQSGISSTGQPIILLLPMEKPFIQALRKIFGRAQSTRGMRLGGQGFGDQYIEEAFVYRIQ